MSFLVLHFEGFHLISYFQNTRNILECVLNRKFHKRNQVPTSFFYQHQLSVSHLPWIFPAAVESLKNHDANTSIARILQNQELSTLIPLKAMITERNSMFIYKTH